MKLQQLMLATHWW